MQPRQSRETWRPLFPSRTYSMALSAPCHGDDQVEDGRSEKKETDLPDARDHGGRRLSRHQRGEEDTHQTRNRGDGRIHVTYHPSIPSVLGHGLPGSGRTLKSEKISGLMRASI